MNLKKFIAEHLCLSALFAEEDFLIFEAATVEIIGVGLPEVALDLELFVFGRACFGLWQPDQQLGVAELEEEVVVDGELGLFSVFQAEDFLVAQRRQEAWASVLSALAEGLFGVACHFHTILQLYQHHVVLTSVNKWVELAFLELRETVQQLSPFDRPVFVHEPQMLNQKSFLF
jgi:hypothetical protein